MDELKHLPPKRVETLVFPCALGKQATWIVPHVLFMMHAFEPPGHFAECNSEIMEKSELATL